MKLAGMGGKDAAAPNSRLRQSAGRYYVIDLRSNSIEASHCDLERWAKDLGVLAPHEELSQ